MNYVYNEENNNIIRVGNELLQKYDLTSENNRKLKAKDSQRQILNSTTKNILLMLCMDTLIEQLKKTEK